MRVYFGACGVGLGHVGRCVPVAKTLLKRGDSVLISTYSEACDYVRSEGLPLCIAPPISFAVRSDGGVDFRRTTVYPGIFSTFIFMRQLNAELTFMRQYRPNFVVSDSRASTIFAAKLLGLPVITLLNIYRVTIPRERRFLQLAKIADGGILTLIGKIWSLGEQVLIPDFPPPYTLSVANLGIPRRRRGKVKLVGPILPVKPETLPETRKIRKKLGIDSPNLILVSISGSAAEKRLIIPLLKKLLRKLPDNNQIVMSLGKPNTTDTAHIDGNLMIRNWLPNRFEYLKACDLVISRAGLGTLTEAISYGKPLILIPTPSQTEQYNNAKRATQLGVAKLLDQRNLNSKSLYSTIDEIFAGDYLSRVGQVKDAVSRFNAVDTIVDIIHRRQNRIKVGYT
jgi:uncharacterized protein (TIGR00661 family)